jgi:hypothetical protein
VESHEIKWWCGILKRHPELKLRKPEPTVVFHHQGMELEVVKSYFEAIRLTLIKHNMVDTFGRPQNLEHG